MNQNAVISPRIFNETSGDGVSQESHDLRCMVLNLRKHLEEQTITHSWKNRLRNQLDEVAEECSERDWDGYGALPVSPEAQFHAWRVIEKLPDGVLCPEITPNNNGEIDLDWDLGENMVFSISVSGNKLLYAGIFGSNRRSGIELFYNAIPDPIEHILKRYFLNV